MLQALKLPSVTAYLVAGVLIGPYCLGLLGIEGLGFPTQEAVDSLSLISEVALGFIAFAIGSEFRVSELKHTGKQAFVIGVLQALTATFVVDTRSSPSRSRRAASSPSRRPSPSAPSPQRRPRPLR